MGGEWSASTYLTGGPVSTWDQEGRGWMGILSCKVFFKSPYVGGWIFLSLSWVHANFKKIKGLSIMNMWLLATGYIAPWTWKVTW